ncbi:MAG: arsenosugar biosynthesis radical SAM protein ArsS [Gammaproteobacteria bacterium]|nr:arsenosugar biosynthesis radical SAM protein ArsS [Gammaproteobacteria bacterium]MCI0591061.1 arsenosugar biosynthesis radical SAM protein ArsS [Gammaproteobacteria bacterium]
MHATLPLFRKTDFPTLHRKQLETLQVNLGYLCNQRCVHCHVNAGPNRKEMMDRRTMDQVIAYLGASGAKILDITGGAPELNAYFPYLVRQGRKLGIHVIDRCNLTILDEPGYDDLGAFLAANHVEIIASLPCYLEENVDRQRGKGVFKRSIRVLRALNELGYGKEDPELILNLIYNPLGPALPPPQGTLEAEYKRELGNRYDVVFNRLYTLTNMPIERFGSLLLAKGQFKNYMTLLRNAHQENNAQHVMCRSLISVDWRGYVYDCDFNQMLGLPLHVSGKPRVHVSDLMDTDLAGNPIMVADHCYGCTAGQGSSCGGALV